MQRTTVVAVFAVVLFALAPAVEAACTFDVGFYGTPPTADIGETVTFNAYAQNFSGCSTTGTNRRFSIDYDGDGSYECVTLWNSCYNSPCKRWCHMEYTTPGTHTPKAKIEWRNNSNGTVVEYATTTITVNQNCAFSAALSATPASTEAGQTVTFNATIPSSSGCSTSGTNRRFLIDYEGNSSWDCVTPWTGCYNSACKTACQHSYPAAASFTAQARVEWRNNANGTVAALASAPVTITGDTTAPNNPTTFSATIEGANGSGRWINTVDPTLELIWSGASDPAPGSGVAGYQIVLQRVSDGAWLYSPQVGNVGSYSLATGALASGESYHYWIRAKDGAGNWAGFKLGGTFSVDTVVPTSVSVSVSNPVWQVDGVSTHDITFTGSDEDSGLRYMYALINLQGGNSPNRRGYFTWSSAGYVFGVNGTDKLACEGGGYATKYNGPNGTPVGYGKEFASLVGCSTSVAGDERTVTFTVLPHTNFGDFSNNDVSIYLRDTAVNISGWLNNDLDFDSVFVDIVPPEQDQLTVSKMDWYADGIRTYDVTATARDTGSGVRELRALINLQGANNANRRGYFAWREASHTWGAASSTDRIECLGGGYAEKYDGSGGSPLGYGKEFVSLVGCSTELIDDERSVTFTVLPHDDFGHFENNDVSVWARDNDLNAIGWNNYDLDYGSTDSTSPAASLRMIVQDNLWFSDSTPNIDGDCVGSNYCRRRPDGSCVSMMPPFLPLLGCTDSKDVHAKAQELQWLQRYTGRDGSGLVISQEWIKPFRKRGSAEDDPDCDQDHDDPIAKNLPRFKSVMKAFGGKTEWNIFYDVSLAAKQRCLVNQNAEKINLSDPGVAQMWKNDLLHFEERHFEEANYWHIGNKPVVYLWNAFFGLQNYVDAFHGARQGLLGAEPVYLLADVQGCPNDANPWPGPVVNHIDGATGFTVLAPICEVRPWVNTILGEKLEGIFSTLSGINYIDYMPAASPEYDDIQFGIAEGFVGKKTLARNVGEVENLLGRLEHYARQNPVAGTSTGYVFLGTANGWPEGTTLLPTELGTELQQYNHNGRIGKYGFTKLAAVQRKLFPNITPYTGPKLSQFGPRVERANPPAGKRRFEVVVDFFDCDYKGTLSFTTSDGVEIENVPVWEPPNSDVLDKPGLELLADWVYRWRASILVDDTAPHPASVVVRFDNLDDKEQVALELLDGVEPAVLCSPRSTSCDSPNSAADGTYGCCVEDDFCDASGTCLECLTDGNAGCTAANAAYYCCEGVCTDGVCGPPGQSCIDDGKLCDEEKPEDCCSLACNEGRCGPPMCDGKVATIVGTHGDDRQPLEGTNDPDVIAGLGGDDIIYGYGGDDVICGGAGNDEIWGGEGNDKLFGQSGRDYIEGEQGGDRIFGGSGKDELHGGGSADYIVGGSGADEIHGGTRSDILRGKGGRDIIYGGGGDDTLKGGKKNDCLYGGDGADDLIGGKGEDVCIDSGSNTNFDESCDDPDGPCPN